MTRTLMICTILLCACGTGVEGTYATNDGETRARDLEKLRKKLPLESYMRAEQESQNWVPGGVTAVIRRGGNAVFTMRDERRKSDAKATSRTIKGEWRIDGGSLLINTSGQKKPLDCAINGKDLACAFTSQPDQRVLLYRQ